MKQPLTAFFRPLLLTLALGLGYSARAQVTYSQVPLTAGSFTADVVANGAAASSPVNSTTADADGGGYYFMSQDYYTASITHTSGIPNNGLIPNSISGYSGLTYQLASLSANNALRLAGGAVGNGTMTFATPTAASEVYVLATSGSGISTVDMTVNYSDGTTTPFTSQSVPDWFTASTALNVFGMTGRASVATPVSTPYAAAGTAPFFDQIKLTIPAAKTGTTITGITFSKISTAGYLHVMAVSIGTYPACTAPPTAGAATATPASLCAGGTSTLTLSTGAATGLTYQWQSSTTSATAGFTNISGATSSSYTTPALTQTTYYRAVVTCSGQSANSAVATVTVLAPTYATVPYTQGFENTWLSRCATDEAPDASWLNTPATGNASWRREDDGASASWSSVTSGAYTPAGSNAGGASSSHSARFHNYYVNSGVMGSLDLYVNMSGGTGTPTLKFDYRNSDTNAVVVLLSTDGGATFSTTPLQTLGNQSAWTSYTVSLPSTVTATTVIRFRATGNFASYDNGLDNVSVSYVTCAQPTAIAATTTAAGATASASVTFTPAVGATNYAFSISPAVTGAPTTVTASPFTLTGLAYSTTYTISLTTNCGSATSSAVTYTFTTPCAPPVYATLPYTQGFEGTWLSRCGTDDVPDNNWANTPLTGNNSWRRDDDGASANWSLPASGAYTPAGSQGSIHSARFHSFYASNNTIGTFDLYANLSATGLKRLTFDYVNVSTSGSKLDVLLSTDGGATFSTTPLLTITTAAAFTAQSVDLTTTSATAVLRFQATSDFGSYDIGVDNVQLRMVPAVDIAATALATPPSTQACYGSAEAIAVTVTNQGAAALNFATNPATITVAVTTPGGSQTLTGGITTGTLAAGATQTVTLTPTLNMSAVGTYTFAITATVTGDANTANDLLTPAPTRTVAAPVAGTLAPAATSLCVSGTATLTLTGAANGTIQYQSSPNGTTFTDIAGATSAAYTTPVLTATTYYRVQVRCNTGTATSNVSTITVNNPLVASTNTPVAICSGSIATLTATPSTGSSVRFFTTATGGTALTNTGTNSYTTPALTANTTYYAEAYTGSSEIAGRTTPTVTTGFIGTNYGLVFTTTGPVTLQSAVIYPIGTGTITFALVNAAGTELAATPALNVTGTGASTPVTIPLNLAVPSAAIGYRLVIKAYTGLTDLLRENPLPTGNTYPFTSPSGLLSFTSGYLSGSTSTSAYYYFYNVAISTECAGATRTAVQVNVTPAPVATFSYPATGSNCAGSTGTVSPTLASGATAGTFTSTTGLTLNATTGVVNLATSTAGTYTVTNTVAATGACPATPATATITVNPVPARPTLTPSYNGTQTTLTSSAATGNQFYFNGVAITGATGQTYVVNGSASTYGAYTVVVTNSFGCSSQASVATTVTTTKGSIAGASIQLFPNPTPDGRVTLALSGLRSATQLAVIDALGRVVSSEQLPATTGTVNHALDLSRLASGVYLLRLTNAEGVETRRVTRE